MGEQLSLRIDLRDNATFDNFFLGKNTQLVQTLKQAIETTHERFYYLWGGPEAVGRTHLLQACCHDAAQQEKSAIYLPLSELINLNPVLLMDLEHQAVICIDDLDLIAGISHWGRRAIFICIIEF